MRKFLSFWLVSLIVVLVCGSALAAEEPSSISFTAVSYDIGVVGNRTAIWVDILPSGASIDDDWIVSFAVTSEEIAAVYSYANAGERIRAIVTGLAPGSTSIDLKVTCADGTAAFDTSCMVHVKPVPVASVSINAREKTFYEGYSFNLSAEVKPDNATDKTVTWSSSAENIVKVNQTGIIRCLRVGLANVFAMAGKKYDVCKITVKASPEWLEEQDAIKILPNGATFDENDGMLVWSGLNDAFEKQKVILRNNDLYGYHIIGFYDYEESGVFKDGWRARFTENNVNTDPTGNARILKKDSIVEIEFDGNEDQVSGEIGIVIMSNGAGYFPDADREKRIVVKFSGTKEISEANENKEDTTGCSVGYGLLAFAVFVPSVFKNRNKKNRG